MPPSAINSFSEFARRLAEAIVSIDKLAQSDPDPMVQSIGRQLRFVQQWTQNGQRPAQSDVEKLSFGIMASRAVDETDSRLANGLYELASYVDIWPPGGWDYIQSRHIGGFDPGPTGDLFPNGTTLVELQEVAEKMISGGAPLSDERRLQTFEGNATLNRTSIRLRLIVDSEDDNRVLTMFPVVRP